MLSLMMSTLKTLFLYVTPFLSVKETSRRFVGDTSLEGYYRNP